MGRNEMLAIGVLVLGLYGIAHAGADPATRCVQKKAQATGKKTADVLRALGKNAKKPNLARLLGDLSKAQSKFTKSFTKEETRGGCQTSNDAATIESKVDAFAFDIVGRTSPRCGDGTVGGSEACDGNDDDACPGRCQVDCACGPGCGNGMLEDGEGCDPPCEQGACADGEICSGFCQCVPDVACTCGAPEPTQLRFVSTAGTGTCGTTQDASGSTIADLDCGSLYVGGGEGDLPLPVPLVANATFVHRVECCAGTSIALGPTSAADTGSELTCTSEGCLFGRGPQPLVNRALLFFSTCLVNRIPKKSTGAIDCSTGASMLSYPVDVDVHLRGIDFSEQHGWQPCPVCVGGTIGLAGSGTCDGGPNDDLACTPGSAQVDLHDCCIDDPLFNGSECTDDSDCGAGTCANDCSAFPTSYDCPPDPIHSLGFIAAGFELVAGAASTLAADESGSFCGFCRDVDIEGSNCFDGDPDPGPPQGNAGCPDSVAQPTCRPATGVTAGCGAPVPCGDAADCTAPYETCEQRSPGAFRNGTVDFIQAVGVAPGDLTAHVPRAGVLADAFCIEPSFVPTIDSSADLPGPGVILLAGESQLLP